MASSGSKLEDYPRELTKTTCLSSRDDDRIVFEIRGNKHWWPIEDLTSEEPGKRHDCDIAIIL